VVQQTQILFGADSFSLFFDQPIEGQAEPAGREQILAIPVIGERARLADQRVDDVPVVHRVLVPTDQTRQRVHQLIRIPHLDTVGEQASLDGLTNQAAVDRVGVAMDVNQTARIDPADNPQIAVDSSGGQRTQPSQLLIETFTASGIACGHQGLKERQILRLADEVATAPHQQGLIDGVFEVSVSGFVVAVFVRLPHVDPFARDAVVSEQLLVTGVELAFGREIVDRRREAVGAVASRHAAEFPQSVLEPVGKGLEGLGDTQGDGLPVGVTQNEVIDEVLKRLPLNGDAQSVHRGEVGGRQIRGVVDLLELDVAGLAVCCLPFADPTLEGASVCVVEGTGMFALEPFKEGLGSQSRFVGEPRRDVTPDPGEGIDACAVRTRRFVVAGERVACTVFACGFVGHVRPPGGRGQCRSAPKLAEQLAYLGIRDHRDPSPIWAGVSFPHRRTRRYRPEPTGNSNCR
jgi:hypothetical protein